MITKKGVNRRDFFKIAATSGATAAVAACNPDEVETLLPRLVPPDDFIAGKPYYFNTTCKACSAHCGIRVKTMEFRAITALGNNNHPLSLGGICPLGQSSLQQLYNPSRIKSPRLNGSDIGWDEAHEEIKKSINKADLDQKKVVFLSSPLSGLERTTLEALASNLNNVEVYYIDLNYDHDLANACAEIFGRKEIPRFNIEDAEAVVGFGADFLESWENPVLYTKKFSKFTSFNGTVKNPYFHVGPHLSLTASNSEMWLSSNLGGEVYIAFAVLNSLLDKSNIPENEKEAIRRFTRNVGISEAASKSGIEERKLQHVINGLSGKKIVALPGSIENRSLNSPTLAKAVMLINYVAGGMGDLVVFGYDNKPEIVNLSILSDLLGEISNGTVGTLFVSDLNLIHSLPQSLGFEKVLENVDSVVGIATSENETTQKLNFVIPSSHFLETWGDSEITNGIQSLSQPVMSVVPGYDSQSLGDIILQIGTNLGITEGVFSAPNFNEALKSEWMKKHGETSSSDSFGNFWKNSLRNGGVYTEIDQTSVEANLNQILGSTSEPANELTLIGFNTGFHNANGTSGDLPWLLEIPNPITQTAWGSWVEVHPDTAAKIGINHGDEVEVSNEYFKGTFGAYVYHGVHPNVVAIPNGLGRTTLFPGYSSRRGMVTPFSDDNPSELISVEVGTNSSNFFGDQENSNFTFSTSKINVKATGKKSDFVTVDGQFRDSMRGLISESKAGFGDRSQKGRGIIKECTPEEAKTGIFNEYVHHLRDRYHTTDTRDKVDFYKTPPETVKESIFFKEPRGNPTYYDPYKFEMTVDLDKCTGCSACVVACYAENNVAVVGKQRMSLGREMSWIRIERYFEEDENGDMQTRLSPEMCKQCENAGCEPVCPVYATYHNPDGLNVQVYNRCVGTRYCANNCIYKQRRFNWRTYEFPSPLHYQLNPDVSVREKGVMEKCTFCAHKIRYAQDIAKDEGRTVRDGEIVTACQSVCPTNAISFGNAKDKNSNVSKLKKDNRSYLQLEEVNFRPSITYLRKVTNIKTKGKH